MAVTLILGGTRSGKSAHAEALIAAAGGPPVYVATAKPGDEEMARRIADHRARRGAHWTTIEAPLAVAATIAEHAGADKAILVECLTLWLANLIEIDLDVDAETDRLVAALGTADGAVVLVSNEVGSGIVPDNALARRFRDAAGRLNQRIAASADTVVLLVAGLPFTLKRDGKVLHG